jgi:hypothetical protein
VKLIKHLLNEYADSDYSPSEVMAKVSSAHNKANHDDNVTRFGLEDSNGDLVVVYVANEQAKDFEYALSKQVKGTETQPEIAELLFKMHEQFNIVNVEWPKIKVDEEIKVEPSETTAIEEPSPESDEEVSDIDTSEEPKAEEVSDSDKVSGVLDSVVKMLIADSEAKKEEALAKAAESKAKEAQAAASIADNKLKAEEEIADMNAYYDKRKEESIESKKLSKLAKYRHELKQDEEGKYDIPDDIVDEVEKISKPEKDEADEDIDEADEMNPNGPSNVNRTFDGIEAAVKYLQSLQVRKQAGNN